MIGTIDVTVRAARPDLPLPPVRAFVGSPSSVRVRNVPRRIGEWDITRVFVTANYPDSTTETAECVLTGGVWVGTVLGCATPGTSLAGFVVTADGVDEHGSAVSGYILGAGDVIVLTREESITPGTITFKGDKGDKGDPGEKGDKGDPGEGAVNSVNGKVGDVVLGANDVDAYTRSETDDKITRFVAHYLTDKVGGRFVPFATHARLADAKAHHSEANPRFFYAGQGFTPTKNDYCVILEDETVEGKTTRYSFVGEWPSGSWQHQYTINDTAFSEAQWAAINSGVTAETLGRIDNTATEAATVAALAQNKADQAQQTAEAAALSAGNAYTTAMAADSKATAAKSIAEDAQVSADDAVASAELAVRTAESKLDKTGDTMTGPLKLNTTWLHLYYGGSEVSSDEEYYLKLHYDGTITHINPDTGDGEIHVNTLPEKDGMFLVDSDVAVAKTLSGTSVTLTDRDCATVDYAAGLTLSFAEASGLRQFEILIKGCEADGSIGVPSKVYRGASDAFDLESGDNHLSFAEQADGSFIVHRMLANTITIGG